MAKGASKVFDKQLSTLISSAQKEALAEFARIDSGGVEADPVRLALQLGLKAMAELTFEQRRAMYLEIRYPAEPELWWNLTERQRRGEQEAPTPAVAGALEFRESGT